MNEIFPVPMKYCLPLLTWFLLSIATFDAVSQISIDYPSSRAVFQRDKINNALVYIAGSYTKSVDRIEARLVPIKGGRDTGWTTIQSNPQGGFYSGNIPGTGGWYELQVRGIKGDQEVGSRTLSPVGIGEVFMVAGQSNGQGFINKFNFDYGAQGAADDRVNCINNFSNNNNVSYPIFSHLDAGSMIVPRGETAWSWGKLGDLLASRFDVPILFYNVAWEGTRVKSWRESINGTAPSPYIDGYYPPGMPYGNLRSVMQNFVPITGLRGVLWVQGEADNQFGTSPDVYFNELKTVIETSRNESGKNISWMVSLTSYTNRYGLDNDVVNGQRKAVNEISNVFQGPNTDLIQVPRTDIDGVHFHHEGLTELAQAFNTQLNDDYFSRSEPFQAASPLQVTLSCAGNNNVNLAVNNVGLSIISWSNGQSSSSIQVGNGTYRVTAKDARGNTLYSPEIRVTENIQPAQPVITLEGSNPVCIGNTATLISNTSENITWNTGSTDARLPVTTGGDYFVTSRNIYGCETASAKLSVAVVNSPLPAKPTIAASGPVTFCEGGEVSLQSNSAVTSVWSTGARTGSIAVKTSGEYTVRALDAVGCYSPVSDPVNVKVNPLPAKPLISLNGPDTFCAGGNVVLTSNYDAGNTWSNAAVTKTITVATSGSFTLKQTDLNGCQSTSDAVNIKVNPLPATPVITALRPTTFCLRDYTTLRSSEAYSYIWSNGATSRDLEIKAAGSFSIVAKDQNGCISPASPAVAVVVNPLPATPVITADGPTTFCADLSVNLQSTAAVGYLWSNGSPVQTLKVTTAGTYSVQTINEFQCYSDASNKITTKTLALPPAPTLQALGLTTFCSGDFVALKATKGSIFIWNTGAEQDTIHVTESGGYTARIKDAQGCFSPYAPEIAVDVKVTPTKPTIVQSGVFTLVEQNNISSGDHIWELNGIVLPENSDTLKAVQSGSYMVKNSITYSAILTCTSDFSDTFNFIVDTRNNGMVAYPNPSPDGRIIIETLQNVNNATVQVIDSRGTIHKTFSVEKFDSQHVFNISDLPAGIYFIRVVSVSFTATQKVIIAK